MLLVLADSIRDDLPRILRTTGLREALTNLARAYREGKHVLFGSARLLRRLADAPELPEDARATFRQIGQRFNDFNTLRAHVSVRAEIEPREGDILESMDRQQRCYHVPLSHFSDSARTQATRLVAEDRVDVLVYERAALAYAFLARLGPGRPQVRLQGYGGGGSSVEDALRDHAREGPTVCVVDADYRWAEPQGKPELGETARKAVGIAKELAGRALCEVQATPCREIENLLPGNLVLDCFVTTDSGDFHQRCVEVNELGLFGGDASVNRLDLKKGLCHRDVRSLEANKPEHGYLVEVFRRHQRLVPLPAGGFCGDTMRCAPGQSCHCVLFKGIGGGLLARVATRLEKLSPEKIAEYLFPACAPHEPAWRAIGILLFSWGCAYPRSRT